jgi:hypothetical protein
MKVKCGWDLSPIKRLLGAFVGGRVFILSKYSKVPKTIYFSF